MSYMVLALAPTQSQSGIAGFTALTWQTMRRGHKISYCFDRKDASSCGVETLRVIAKKIEVLTFLSILISSSLSLPRKPDLRDCRIRISTRRRSRVSTLHDTIPSRILFALTDHKLNSSRILTGAGVNY